MQDVFVAVLYFVLFWVAAKSNFTSWVRGRNFVSHRRLVAQPSIVQRCMEDGLTDV